MSSTSVDPRGLTTPFPGDMTPGFRTPASTFFLHLIQMLRIISWLRFACDSVQLLGELNLVVEDRKCCVKFLWMVSLYSVDSIMKNFKFRWHWCYINFFFVIIFTIFITTDIVLWCSYKQLVQADGVLKFVWLTLWFIFKAPLVEKTRLACLKGVNRSSCVVSL